MRVRACACVRTRLVSMQSLCRMKRAFLWCKTSVPAALGGFVIKTLYSFLDHCDVTSNTLHDVEDLQVQCTLIPIHDYLLAV